MIRTKQIFEHVEYGDYNKLTHTYPKKITPLDVMVNQYLAEEGIEEDQLIDIKYSTILADEETQSSAFIIYRY